MGSRKRALIRPILAMAENAVLKRFAEPLMKRVRRMSKNGGETEHRYGECRYAARSWNHERLLELGAWFKRSVRRVILHLPDSAPWRSELCRVARALGAVPS